MSLVTLSGVGPVKKQLRALARFQSRVNRVQRGQISNYRQTARDGVRDVIYNHPENPDYPRSMNTLAATDVAVAKSGDGDSITTAIFLNPAKATRPFQYKFHGGGTPKGIESFGGKFPFYPSYMRRGILFNRSIAPRDFMRTWLIRIGPEYRRSVGRAIRNFRSA